MIVAIVACEIGFWALLAAGLFARYLLRRRRLSTALLVSVPLVDLALFVFTVIDLRSGTEPNGTHALAVVYLGFSVAFGHDLIRWADRRVAHRVAGGPPPPAKPAAGTAARLRKEWRDWGLAALGFVITAALTGVMALLVGGGAEVAPLFGSLPGLGIALIVWLIGWPVTETVRAARRR